MNREKGLIVRKQEQLAREEFHEQVEGSERDLQRRVDSLEKQVDALKTVLSFFAQGLDKVSHVQANLSDAFENIVVVQEEQISGYNKMVESSESNTQLLKRMVNSMENLQLFEDRIRNEGGVFISYSHADRAIVTKISKRFEKHKINHWLDDKDIRIGETIDKAISKGIQNNLLFLIVLSPTSIKSKWVEREFDEASHEEIEGKKYILPVVVNGLKDEDIPARIRRRLYVNLSNDFDAGYKKLRSSIISYVLDTEKKAT